MCLMNLRQHSILALVVHTIVSDIITLLNSYYITAMTDMKRL